MLRVYVRDLLLLSALVAVVLALLRVSRVGVYCAFLPGAFLAMALAQNHGTSPGARIAWCGLGGAISSVGILVTFDVLANWPVDLAERFASPYGQLGLVIFGGVGSLGGTLYGAATIIWEKCRKRRATQK